MFRNFFIVILVLALVGCENKSNTLQTGIVGENEPITRAEVARMVALNNYNIEEINSLERKITFKDTDINKWYDKYINAAYTANLIAGVDNENFAPDEFLSLRQAQFLLDKIKSENRVKLQYRTEDKDKPIPYNIWVTAFEKDMNTERLKSETIKVYADKNQCKKLGDNFVITDLGLTYYDGNEKLTSANEVSAIVNNRVIVALKSINAINEFDNLEVVDANDKYVKVKVPGGIRKFEIKNNNAAVGDKIKIVIDNNGIYSIQ